jgi:lysozyme
MDIREMIKRHEGCRLKAYKDSLGFKTIGYGHLMSIGDKEEITNEEAEAMFEKDFQTALSNCRLFIAGFDALSENRRGVLVDMCFNLGLKGLLGFKNTLAMIKAGKFEEAATNMLNSKWASQVKTRAGELASIMKEG